MSFAENIRFVPDGRISEAASSSGVMDAGLFARTALVASGSDDAEMDDMVLRLDDIYKSFVQQNAGSADDVDTAEKALLYLHDTVLTSYSEKQTLVSTALAEGSYNCVSSAILFMYMMKRLGIPVVAVETPLHAFCTVSAGGRLVDVETTNAYGFDPGVQKPLTSRSYVTVPAKKYAGRHNVDDRRIIALIYNNRMAALQSVKLDGQTIGLACDAAELQGYSGLSLDTLRLCIYNTAVDYMDSGEEGTGLALVADAKQRYGDTGVYHQFAAAAVGKMLNSFMQSNDYDACFAALRTYSPMLEQKDYDMLYQGATVNCLNYAVKTKSFDEAAGLIRKSSGSIPADAYGRVLSYAYSNEADRIAAQGAWLDAAALLEKGLSEVPGNSILQQQRSVYRRNYAAEVHNKAAALYNAGKKDEARRVIEQGLVLAGDSTILKNDLRRMQAE